MTTRSVGLLLWVVFDAFLNCDRAFGDTEGDALAQKFFAHLKANAPITGVFEIHTVKDREALERQKQVADSQSTQRAKLTFGGLDQLLRCRWAWDGRREVCESLPGSHDVFEHGTFFQNREALLVGHNKNLFSLRPSSSPAVWRPASFYFLSSTTPWSQMLEDCTFHREKNGANNADGEEILIARTKDGQQEHRLRIQKDSGALKSAQMFFDSQLIFDLQIKSYAFGSDLRCFPQKAMLDIYVPNIVVGRPMTRHTLTAKTIEFPDPQTSNSNFRLELPKGARIGDQILDRVIDLEAPTQAIDVIEGKVKSRPVSQTKGFSDFATSPAKSDALSWKWILPSAAIAILVGLGVIRLVTKGVRRINSPR